jgi:CHAT domain-containing protein
VVGSTWKVEDAHTAVLMYAFHHYLRRESRRPAAALRAAQLWMLDPDRGPLPGMPPGLAGRAALPELADVAAWAAFGHRGR